MKYPNIKVTQSDIAMFTIVGAVSNALRRGGVSKEERVLYLEEALGDNATLETHAKKWVEVEAL